MRAVVLALVLAAFATGRARAQAADAPAMTGEARAHWERGLAEHAAHHYQAGGAEFAACYRLAQRRECLFAWAQATRLAGDCETARELYRRYLQGDLSPRQAEAARGQLAACEAQIAARAGGRADATGDPRIPAEPRTSSAQPGVEPRGALAQPTGEPRASTALRTSSAQPGVESRGALAQPAEPRGALAQPDAASARSVGAPGAAIARPATDRSPPVDAPPGSPWYRDRWGDVLLGGGVAAVAAGAAIYVSARRDAASSAPTYDAYAERFQRAESARRWALAAIGAGSALIAGGVIHMVLREDAAPAAGVPSPAPRVDLVLDGAHLAVGYAGAF